MATNSIKSLCAVSCALALTMFLTACTLADNSITSRQKTCGSLKNQITFSRNYSGVGNVGYNNPTQSAQAMRSYEKNNCTELEK